MECETQESEAGYTNHLNLYYPKADMCRFRVNQHCVSINKILVTEFVTVKVSWNLNLM